MELPVAPQSYEVSPDTLLRAAKRVRIILARTVATETTLDHATAFTCGDRPGVRLANYAAEVTAGQQDEPADVVREILAHFQEQQAPCHTIESADVDWPQRLRPFLATQGYQPVTRLVFTMQHTVQPARINDHLQIIPARAAYKELPPFYQAMVRDAYCTETRHVADLSQSFIDRLDEPRLELFLGRLDGLPVAIAGVITLGNIGVIEPAFTLPAYRGKAIGTTMMAHTLEYCCRASFEHVIIERNDGCSSVGFYESLGFKKVTSYVRYISQFD